jgi:Fe-S-cluster-containing dehydrogenase component/DMSO reductase anchor subunit
MTQARPFSNEKTLSLIDQFLLDQASLTAVSDFARAHDSGSVPGSRYHKLLPLHAPRPGEQYAFEVDLDLCSGCKACVTACHALNGLDDNESWRGVQVIRGVTRKQPVLQTITSACHHCIDPACLNGCPVLAYEKDSITGIVRHLDDQCIGCQYCVLKCPYDVPKYSAARGIVRKCDMCTNRLSEGEAPACVQACPNEAIQITLASRTESLALRGIPDVSLLNATVSSSYTIPTTRYRTQKAPPLSSLVELEDPAPEPLHTPLVLMLVFTQMSLGVFSINAFIRWFLPEALKTGLGFAPTLGVISCFAGLAASVFHLGRPQYAWKAFLNWRKSWLSREVIAFGVFGFFSFVAVLLPLAGHVNPVMDLPVAISASADMGLILSGAFGVFCSAKLYADTWRPFWSMNRTAAKFFGTASVLGAGSLFALGHHELPVASIVTLIVISVAKMAVEIRELTHPDSDILGSSFLLRGPLGLVSRLRFFCGIIGGVVLPALSLLGDFGQELPWIAFALCLAGELLERILFFKAVIRWKMPGSP